MKNFKKVFLKKIQRAFLALAGLGFGITLTSHSVKADVSEAPAKDLTEFFKQAISNPPDIEHFRASQRNLRPVEFPPELIEQIKKRGEQVPQSSSSPIFFEGSRAGSNLIMRRYASDSSGQPDWAANVVTLGRRGDVLFSFSGKTLSYVWPGTANTINDSVKMEFLMSCQLLNMGLSDIKAGSVVWRGLQFDATSGQGVKLRGELELSNNIPNSLKFFENNAAEPSRKMAYFYPVDAAFLSGFPNKIINSDLKNGRLVPSIEIDLLEIKLARAPLSAEYFDEFTLGKGEIKFTNYYSNNVAFSQGPNGTILKLKPPKKRGKVDKLDSNMRIRLIYIGFFVLAVISVLILLKSKRNK